MRKSFLPLLAVTVAFALWCVSAGAQQQGSATSAGTEPNSASQSTPKDVPSPDDVADAKSAPSADSSGQPGQPADQSANQQQNADQKPSRGERVKKHVKDQMSSWCVGAPLNHCYEKKQGPDADGPDAQKTNGKNGQTQIPPPPRSDDTAPPVSRGESSSKDTKVDLSPPPGDASDHPDSSADTDAGPAEFHAWDPHRAMKNIEVGDYYYKRENYRAALSRYQEALQWKPRDAEATFKLADAYEKMGDNIDARHNYEQYLAILPKGPRAEDAHKALARLR